MSEEEQDQTTITIERALKELALLPILGFILAFCYEGAFLYFSGLPLRLLLSFSDFAQIAAVAVLPMIPIMLFGFGLASPTQAITGNAREKTKAFFANITYYLVGSTVFLMALAYLLLGAQLQLSISAVFLLLLMLAGRLFLFQALVELGRDGFLFGWLLLVACVVFASYGANEAFAIRSGERDGAVVSNLSGKVTGGIILRTYERGFLLGNDDPNHIYFLDRQSLIQIELEIDPDPFRGILCYTMDWCWASGW